MAVGQANVNNLNLMQGDVRDVENYLVFIGTGSAVNEGKLISINTDTDLDAVLGADSNLKTQIIAAKDNAGQGWNAAVIPLADGQDAHEATLFAFEQEQFEGFVFTDPVTATADVEAMYTTAKKLHAKYGLPAWGCGCFRGLDDGETWEEYLVEARKITDGVAADCITMTALLWGREQGAYMGRLCNKTVTVADTPMRVKTGPLVGGWADKAQRPTDANGRVLDMAIVGSLDMARYSIPQWYRSYDGIYFTDGNVLDVDGGDYQVIEYVRPVFKAMRQVYPIAVSRIGDRSLNETPASIAAAKMIFAKPLRAMAKSVTINGITFPGEIYPPNDKSIVIEWLSKTKVVIYITVRPYNCPKDITVNILLDLENYG